MKVVKESLELSGLLHAVPASFWARLVLELLF